MRFKQWFVLSENVEANFEYWLSSIVAYSKPNEKQLLDKVIKNNHLVNNEFKPIIINVLKENHLENMNWFSFCIGFLVAKNFRKEDLELAIDVTKKRIDSRELTKPEIGSKGWLLVGYESIYYVKKHLDEQQKLSKREEERIRKRGETINNEDENYIKLVLEEKKYKIYHIEGVLEPNEEKIKARHRVLCKYGKGTEWCTANPSGDYHKYYLENDIYIINKDNKPEYQFTSCFDNYSHQFMDVHDQHPDRIEDDLFEILLKSSLIFPLISCYYFIKNKITNEKLTPEIINFIVNGENGDLKVYLIDNPHIYPNLPREVLIKLSDDNDNDVRINIAKKENTPAEILLRLSRDKTADVMHSIRHLDLFGSLLRNDKTPKEAIINIYKTVNDPLWLKRVEGDPKIYRRNFLKLYSDGIARHPNTPKSILIELMNKNEEYLKLALLENPSISQKFLLKLSDDNKASVRSSVARNLKTPKEILAKLSNDKDVNVRVNIAANPNTPKEILNKLASDDVCQLFVAENPKAPEEALIKLSDNKNDYVVLGVAKNRNTPAQILIKLSSNPFCAQALRQNPNTPEAIKRKLNWLPEWSNIKL
jgi:hypothetical protein